MDGWPIFLRPLVFDEDFGSRASVAKLGAEVWMRVMWWLCSASAIGGGVFGFLAVTGAEGAPQQAAGAAIACAMAVVPYVIARAAEGERDAKARAFNLRNEMAARAARGGA
jgi:hypothetical protein